MAKTIVMGNFKGGVGKTKVSVMTSWEMTHEFNKKVLLVDMDPQGNASTLIARSVGIEKLPNTIFNGFEKGDLAPCILEITEKLHLLPASLTFKNLPKFLYSKFEDELEQISYLKKLLEPLKDDYDYIIIDVPPTISDFSDNAMLAADYVLIILQAQELSLEGSETYVSYLQFMADNYDADIQVAGVLPVLLRPGSRVDNSTVERAKDLFGDDNVMVNEIRHLERLKVWDVTGITKDDQHDRKAHRVFIKATKELMEKIDAFEEAGKYE